MSTEKSTQDAGRSRSFRAGGYSILAAAVVIAIAIFINLMAERLPATYTKLDFTAGKLFEISDQTRKLLGSLQHDVDIYHVSTPDQKDSYVVQLLEVYAGLSPRIKLHTIDPIVYPNFAAQFTTGEVYNNSLVVQYQGRSRFVGLMDLFLYEMDYNTGNSTQDWNGESALTSAIDYVVSDDLPVVYTLKGHGEAALPETLLKMMDTQNMQVSELQLLTNAAIPEDANTLIINGPTTDVSTDEAGIIRTFLKSGGRLMLLTDYSETAMPNLMGLMAEYGVSLERGIVIEGDMNACLRNVAYYLLPYLRFHDITAPLIDGSYRTVMPIAQGIVISSGLPSGIEASPLVVSSTSSFSKLAGHNMTTYEKEEGDLDGPFNLAVAIEDTTAAGSRIVWLTTSQLLVDEHNTLVAGANYDFFVNALGWMNQRENTISIHAKSLAIEKLVVPSAVQTQLSILFIGVMPLAFLAVGILITIRRRRA